MSPASLPPLTPAQYRVFTAIAARQKHLTNSTPPLSITWIACDAGLCEKQTRVHIAALRRYGYITAIRDRAGVSYIFTILWAC